MLIYCDNTFDPIYFIYFYQIHRLNFQEIVLDSQR